MNSDRPIDYSNAQTIYDTVRAAGNKTLYAICGQIATMAANLDKLERDQVTRKELASTKEQEKHEGVDETLNTLSLDSTDEELRLGARAFLIGKLKDNAITASEFAQFKDVFGLASQSDELRIITTDYSNAIIDCPHCSGNVHQPILDIEPTETA